ncbi:MAG: ornithine carbamoyltransferase [Desulfarculales bacterium]|jgi:ornithine carbamoyltransferase|nr:ornithine carbamoyltransferase [Desulfarculales bacterium]
MPLRHLLRISDLSGDEIMAVIFRAGQLKKGWKENKRPRPLIDKTVALIFEKPSTRTRVSFETGISQLGGQAVFMSSRDSQISRAEPIRDTARVMSRYVHALVVRTFGQEIVEELAAFASIPVINALTDQHHPCQVLSDLLTVYEQFGCLEGLRCSWLGDGNNMANSWIEAAVRLNFKLVLGCPPGFYPDRKILAEAARADITVTEDPAQAVAGAQVVSTDVWASMGQEAERARRVKIFEKFRLDNKLLAGASPEAVVLHCLPAHRDEEISDEIMEGPRSLVWEQAGNRLHVQKALLEFLIRENP